MRRVVDGQLANTRIPPHASIRYFDPLRRSQGRRTRHRSCIVRPGQEPLQMNPPGAVAIAEREFAFSDADFKRIRDLIYGRAGISLADGKRQMVYSRLGRRLRVLGLTSFRAIQLA